MSDSFYRFRYTPTNYFELLNNYIKPRYNSKVPKNRKQVKRILHRFREMGWKNEFLKYKFRYLSDEHVKGLPVDYFVFEIAMYWLRRVEDQTHAEIAFRSVGLNKNVAKYIHRIVTPLKNTFYTDYQLLEIGVEHLLGLNSPMFGPSTHEVIQEILKTGKIPQE
jgi:hypothetical protein